MPRLALALVALSLLASGCIGGGPTAAPPRKEPPTPTPDPAPSPLPAPAPRVNVTRYNGSVSGAWVPGVVYVSPSEDHSFTVNVTNATRALVIEVAWRTGDALSVKLDVPAKYCTSSDPLGFLVS